ncbi:hypothetical protein MMUC44124_02370 [Mycolicibacterium mucogenicum DSM 44124]|nr:hypothetical protein MMUC44124_02370 [Mycolicibacterium mucogenicum DSM 44124]
MLVVDVVRSYNHEATSLQRDDLGFPVAWQGAQVAVRMIDID